MSNCLNILVYMVGASGVFKSTRRKFAAVSIITAL